MKYFSFKLFNLIVKVVRVPEDWCKGFITPVYKSGDPGNYRPLCVLSCLDFFLTNILNARLQNVLTRIKIIHVTQNGAIDKHRTTDHILTSLISKNVSSSSQRKICGCFVDFKKAYDLVWH